MKDFFAVSLDSGCLGHVVSVFGCVTTKMTRLASALRISDLGADWLFEMNYSKNVKSTIKGLMFHWLFH